MKLQLFIGFITLLAKGAAIICIGEIIRSHFETVISMIIRRPIPENLISPENYNRAKMIISIIGILIIISGIFVILLGLFSLISGTIHFSTFMN